LAIGPQNSGKKPGDDKQKQKDDAAQDVFMREVDDALREDQLETFWKDYGRWLLGIIVIGLAAFGGWLFYSQQQEDAAGLAGEEYSRSIAALKENNIDGAEKAAIAMTDADQPGYRAAAQMLQAGIAEEKNSPEKAAEIFAKVAADEELPQAYRDVALLRQTLAEFDKLKPETVVARLKPLAVPGNPYFGTAGELTALAYAKMKKPDLAGAMFAQIAEEETVPESIRDRAKQMAGQYGLDVSSDVQDDEPVGTADAATADKETTE